MAKQNETIKSGVVTGLNDFGIKIDAVDGWLDWSKFYKGHPEPDKGDRVELRLQEKDRGDGYWIMHAKIAGQPDNGPRPSGGERDFERAMERQGSRRAGGDDSDPIYATPASELRAAPGSRDALIVRQVALKCAVEFNAGRQVALDGVLADAEDFYAWLLAGA